MRAEWELGYFGILSALAETNISVLSGVGTKEGGTSKSAVRAVRRSAISALIAKLTTSLSRLPQSTSCSRYRATITN